MPNEFKVKNGLIVDAGGAQITGGITGSTDFNTIVNKPTLISSSAQVTSITQTVTGTNSAELVRGNMADNDQFRILVGGTATNAGFAEIATADDGSEPIHVRQYTGVFSSLVRTATLLDTTGNTSFPSTVSATSFGYTSQISSNGGELVIGQNQIRNDRNGLIIWGGTAGVNSIRDLGLRRNNTGSLEIYDGVTTDGAVANRRDLILRDITGSNAFFSGSSTITGSLGVTGSLSIGSIGSSIGSLSVSGSTNLTGSLGISGSTILSGSLSIGGGIPSIFGSTGTGSLSVNGFTNLTGSVSITGSTSITGSIIATNGITGSIAATNGVVSGSSQVSIAGTSDYTSLFTGIASATSSLNTFSSSQNTKNSTLATLTGSIETKFAAFGASTSSLNAFTSSIDSRFSALQASTASLNVYTQSNDTLNTTQNARLTALEVATGSSFFVSQSVFLINNYTGSDAVSQSVTNTRLLSLGIASSSLEFFTASQNTKNSTLALYTGSNDTKWANLAVYTASVDTKFLAVQSTTNSLNLYTASIRTALTASGVNLTANGALVVTLDVTASAFKGAGTGLTGTASGLSIGGNAATATTSTDSTKLPLAGGTLTGALLMGGSVAAASNTQPTALSYGLLQGYGTFNIAADTDASTTEYAIITAGYSVANATAANGLAVGFNTLAWKSTQLNVNSSGQLSTNFTGTPYHVTHRPAANATFNIGSSTGNGSTIGPFVNCTINAISDTTSAPIFFNCSQFSVFVGYSEQMRLISGGILYIGDGIVQYYGSWSDRKLKQNLKVIDNPLDKISKLNGYTFEWTKDSPYRNTPEIGERIKDAGLIAQDVEEVLPEVVTEKNKSKHLNYNGVTALHTEGIKELIKQNQELLERIKKLEEKLL